MVFGHGKNNKRKIDNDLSWYGHRGLLRRAPENTLQGFSAAIDEGLRSVEIDVLRTKDGKIVCSHNFDLEKETDGSGYIDQKNRSELELIDAATNWPNAEAKIPTLESVLAQLPKECGVNIEIKTSKPIDWLTPVGVIKIIKKLKIQRGVIISSFNPIVLRIVKSIDSSFETGLLFKDIRAVGLISFARPNYVHPRSDITTNDLIKYAQRYKLGINVWTVNSRPGMEFFMEKKVNGIITDYPEAIPSGI